MTPAFLLLSLAVVATPGTGVVLTVSAALRAGRRHALITAIGCTLGTVPHLLAAITGTAAVLHAGGIAFTVVKFAGVAYLGYLAVLSWRDDGSLATEHGEAGLPPAMRTIRKAVLANLLNPKLTLFFVAFLPQFVRPGSGATGQLVLLGGVFMAVTLVVFSAYGWGAAAMRRHILGRASVVRRIQRVLAGGYVVIGARLATVRD